MAAAGLEEIKDRSFGELSGGQRQRVLFALAICGNPDIVFLDEPTVGLDVEARRMLWDQIRKLVSRGKTILLTTHYLQEADALADRVVVINQGQRSLQKELQSEIKAADFGQEDSLCQPAWPIEVVRAFPGVMEAKADREAIEITAKMRRTWCASFCCGMQHFPGWKLPVLDWKTRSWHLTQSNN